jgi:hypothetical protein
VSFPRLKRGQMTNHNQIDHPLSTEKPLATNSSSFSSQSTVPCPPTRQPIGLFHFSEGILEGTHFSLLCVNVAY